MIDYDASKSALYTPGRRPTLFVNGAMYSPLQLCIEAARLAYVDFENSDAGLRSLTNALARVGFGKPEPFVDAKTGTEAFGAYRAADRAVLVAFRGTQPDQMTDVFADLKANQVAWTESDGRVHAGFATAMRSVKKEIDSWLDTAGAQRRSLFLCGHSLGAALATLAATIWGPSLLVTIGSPRVGDAKFAASLNDAHVMRLVDCSDLVTLLPPALTIYTHVGPMTYIDRHGEVKRNPDSETVLKDRAAAHADYLVHYAIHSDNVASRAMADHAPINYARAFFP